MSLVFTVETNEYTGLPMHNVVPPLPWWQS